MKHDGWVRGVAFSLDGTKIATASIDGTARLWDAATGKPLGPPMEHGGRVTAVAFSPDGSRIATATVGAARLWQVPRSLPDDPAWIGAYVGAASAYKEDADGTLHPITAEAVAANWTEVMKSPAWLQYRKAELEKGQRSWHEEEAARWQAAEDSFAASFHLKWLLDRNPQDSELRRRLTALTRTLSLRLPGARKLIAADDKWSFSPSGKEIACACPAESVRGRWDLRVVEVSTGEAKLLVQFGHNPAWQPADGRWIAFERRGALRDVPEVWLVPSGGGAAKKLCDGQYPAWSADGKMLYCFSQASGGIVSVNLATSRQTRVFATSDPFAAISPDAKRVAHLKGQRLVIDDIATGRTLRACPLPGWDGLIANWSPDGKQVAFGRSDDSNRVGLWLLDAQSGGRTLIAAGPWTMPIWSPDGSKFTFQDRRPGQKAIWIVEAKDLAKLKPWAEESPARFQEKEPP